MRLTLHELLFNICLKYEMRLTFRELLFKICLKYKMRLTLRELLNAFKFELITKCHSFFFVY